MTKMELKKRLDDALEDYKADMNSFASDEYSKRPVTEGELAEYSKHVFYVLNSFKDAILDYLD